MTISGININNLLASQVSSTSGTGKVGHMPPPPPMGMTGEVDGIDMSKPGEMFSQLEKLQKSDPAKFKQVVSDIADKLEAASKDSTAEGASSMLSDLAAKFRDVANGGDISEIKPPESPSYSGSQDGISQYKLQQAGTQSNLLSGSTASSSSSSSLQDLFNSIFDEVNKAVSALG